MSDHPYDVDVRELAGLLSASQWDPVADCSAHITASAIVVAKAERTTALVLHQRVGRFLAPGGHLRPNEPPLWGALREASEELSCPRLGTHVTASTQLPIDLDIHEVEDDVNGWHRHLDFRFGFFVEQEIPVSPKLDEVSDARWVSLGDPRVEMALGTEAVTSTRSHLLSLIQ